MAGIGTFRIVDPTDTTKVEFDCNDIAGTAGNPGALVTAVRELQLRVPDREIARFSPRMGIGARTVFTRDDLVASAWRQAIPTPAAIANLRTGLGELSRLLRRGGTIEFAYQGDADTLYIDYEKGSGGPLLGDDAEDPFRAVTSGAYPEGIPILIARAPGLRGAKRVGSVNVLKNPLLLYDQIGTANRPDNWDWASALNISAESVTKEAYQFTAATASDRDFQQDTAAASAAVNDVFAASFYAETDAGSGARMRCVIRFLDNTGTPIGAESVGTLVTLASREQRLSIVSAAAPASTDRVRIICRVQDTDGTARVIRLRKAQLEKAPAVSGFRVGTQTAGTDPSGSGGRLIALHIDGTAPAPVELRIKAQEAAAKILEVICSLRSNAGILGGRSLTDWANTTKFAECEATGGGWTVTLSGDTTAPGPNDATASGSGSNKAVTNYASNPTVMAKRIRLTRTTLLDSLRGDFDVWARVKETASAKHTIQLRYSASLADPATDSRPEVIHDPSANGTPASFGWVMLNLGKIHIPDDTAITLAGLALELWSRRDSGTGNLEWDHLMLVPAEQSYSRLYVPAGSSESWLGKDLVTPVTNPAGGTAGTVPAGTTQLRLDSSIDNCGTPPNTGLAWPVARHRITFVIQQTEAGTGSIICRVRNITDSSTVATQNINTSPRTKTIVLEFDSAAGKSYQPQVDRFTASKDVYVNSIKHETLYYVAQNEQIRTDPSRASGPIVEKIDTNAAVASVVAADGPISVWCEPGLNLLYLDCHDIAIQYYSEGESVLARAPTVEAVYAPRYLL